MRRILLFITTIVLAVSGVSSSVSAISGELQPGSGLQMKEISPIFISNVTAKVHNGVWMLNESGSQVIYLLDGVHIGGGKYDRFLNKYTLDGQLLDRNPLELGSQHDYDELSFFIGRDNYFYSTGRYSAGGVDEYCTLKRSLSGNLVDEMCINGEWGEATYARIVLATLSDGRMLVVDGDGIGGIYSDIYVMSPEGERIGTIEVPGNVLVDNAEIATINHVAVGDEGAIYVIFTSVGAGYEQATTGVLKYNTVNSSPEVLYTFDGYMGYSGFVSPAGDTFVHVGLDFNKRAMTLRTYNVQGEFTGELLQGGDVYLGFNTVPAGIDKNGILYFRNVEDYKFSRFVLNRKEASFPGTLFGKSAHLELGGDASLLRAEVKTLSELSAPADAGKSYPFGLLSFTAAVDSTDPVPVEFIVETDLKPSDVEARKYNSVTKQYATIPGAIVTETDIEGKPALKLTYPVTDGGALDEDGVVNGMIIDPVGLAVTGGSTGGTSGGTTGGGDGGGAAADGIIPGVPNTGFGAIVNSAGSVNPLATLGVAVVVIGVFAAWRRFRKTPLSFKKQ